jgi:hypothetical protein
MDLGRGLGAVFLSTGSFSLVGIRGFPFATPAVNMGAITMPRDRDAGVLVVACTVFAATFGCSSSASGFFAVCLIEANCALPAVCEPGRPLSTLSIICCLFSLTPVALLVLITGGDASDSLGTTGRSIVLTVLSEPVSDPGDLCKDSFIPSMSFWIDERKRVGVPGPVVPPALPDREFSEEAPPIDCCDHGDLS